MTPGKLGTASGSCPHARQGVAAGTVTFTYPGAAKLSRALRLRGVVPDFRPPDMILADAAHHELPDADAPVT
ncbi:hypothetical protein [Limnoglobus roseus]|uniref:Uncharacterized protein n=1 Tax=Limnoglobus roseus TaxID=2598579 RepID=A0A5C1ADW3_9BACT|nr:hypothetical protein [Limnoglobus roseus]QEL16377.1 hypothetical protein PX52LOC_03327 [Limnoglobus roseus]